MNLVRLFLNLSFILKPVSYVATFFIMLFQGCRVIVTLTVALGTKMGQWNQVSLILLGTFSNFGVGKKCYLSICAKILLLY